MAYDVQVELADFGDTTLSARLVRAVMRVVPFAPPFPTVASLDDAIRAAGGTVTPAVLARAQKHAAAEGALGAMWMGSALDKADGGLALYTGVKNAVAAWREGAGAFSTDSPQAADAVLKGFALAYIGWKLFPGTARERVDALRATDAGKAMLVYYASIEVGLPFADNVVRSGGSFLETLVERWGGEEADKITAVAGSDATEDTLGAFDALLEPLEGMITQSAKYLQPIANAASEHLPKALDVADKVAGAVAVGADVLPVWRMLVARLVAEVAARRAIAEIAAEPAPPPPPPSQTGKVVYQEPAKERDPLPPPPAPQKPSPIAVADEPEERGGAPVLMIALALVAIIAAGGLVALVGGGLMVAPSATSPAASTTEHDATTPGKAPSDRDRSRDGKASKAGKGR
jgi:hypothetical protein